MSGTRWSDDWEVKWYCMRSTSCIRRCGAWVSWLSLKSKVDDLSVISKPLGQFLLVYSQTRWLRFFGLDLKTGSSDLVIWASKSLRQFLNLCLKTKRDSVCRLRHKTDGGRLTWDTRRVLVTCLVWKKVGVEFFSLTSRLVDTWLRMVHVTSSWRSRRVEAEDGWVNVIDCIEPFYSKIIVFNILGTKDVLVFHLLLCTINRT
jgi:hypothetical protein